MKDPSSLKRCTKCGLDLPQDAFHWKVKELGYRQSQCRECQKRAERERLAAKREQLPPLEERPKRCTRCGETKARTEFVRQGKYPSSRCKPCIAEIQRDASALRRQLAPRVEPRTTKKCTRCGEEKLRSEFNAKNKAKGHISGKCRACIKVEYHENRTQRRAGAREWYHAHSAVELDKAAVRRAIRGDVGYESKHLKYLYGITVEQYREMEAAQDGRCAICKQPETQIGRGGRVKKLAVDHDPKTGRVRELLCAACNTSIGKFGHDVDRLRAAIAYLERHAEPPVD